jgi:molybdenum cofactor biosynthesis enzyme MoaA
MNKDFSKTAFFRFLDYVSKEDLIKFQTVRGWRTSASKLMMDLSEAEDADIRTVDLDLAIRKTVNRDSIALSPQSLKTYRHRVLIAINEFIKYQSDPNGYEPQYLNGQSRTKSNGENGVRQEQAKQVKLPSSDKQDREIVHVSSGLTLSYPLRTDFLAQIVIPRDLNTTEAKRLAGFLLTIAVDYKPE